MLSHLNADPPLAVGQPSMADERHEVNAPQLCLGQSDAWIDPVVHDINDQVDRCHDGSYYYDYPLDYREVAVHNRQEGQSTYPWPGKDSLDHHRPTYQKREIHTTKSDHGEKSVTQCMLPDYTRRRNSLHPGEQHIVAAKNLQHAGADKTHDSRSYEPPHCESW